MKALSLTLTALLLASPALADPTPKPTPSQILRAPIKSLIGKPPVTTTTPPAEVGPPSEISGYIVIRDGAGNLRPSGYYPIITLRFVSLTNPGPGDRTMTVSNAGSGLESVQNASGVPIAWHYAFWLSADRATRSFNGTTGIEYDPEHDNAIRFNPDLFRYDGFTAVVHERVTDPNTNTDVGPTGTGVPRATPYTDTRTFTH